MEENFVDWLLEEIEKRGWSISHLARQAGVAQSTISLIVSGQRQPGPDVCRGIAEALGEPPERVFRLARLLPPLPGGEVDLEDFLDMLDYVKRLSPERRAEIMRYLIFSYHEQTRQNREQANQANKPEDKEKR